jgi:endonuclease-3
VVDTHVGRVSQRLGLTTNEDPVKIEFDLMELIPRERWVTFSHQLILHGRKVCSARKPMCSQCPLIALCNYAAESLALNSGGDAASPRRVKSKNPH